MKEKRICIMAEDLLWQCDMLVLIKVIQIKKHFASPSNHAQMRFTYISYNMNSANHNGKYNLI